MNKLTQLLRKIFPAPPTIPTAAVEDLVTTKPGISDRAKEIINRLGSYTSEFGQLMLDSTFVNFERIMLYREIDRALMHWAVGAAAELYADYTTTYDKLRGCTVWVTSENKLYQQELNNMLQQINIEEKIYDWTYTTGVYGDLFVAPEGIPGMGIIGVNDDEHPMNVSRLDKNVLLGFYKTPSPTGGAASVQADLMPPWQYVHFRTLGSKRRRTTQGDPLFSQYSSVHFLSQDNRQMSSKYGTSLLVNALGPYKRLRLAEDSLLMARASRGVEKYVYKLKVDDGNIEAVESLIDMYSTLLKKARAVDTRDANPYFDQQLNLLSALEDIIVPVWGDVGDLDVTSVGGDANIRWIVDIEELRNQLATSLRCPLSLLGGYVQEATGALGSTSLEKLDIRFARSSRRLQRAIIEGITRLCQIHLAYLNQDPDPSLFQVNMPETSTAEEQELVEILNNSVDALDKFMNMLNQIEGVEFDKQGVLSYLSNKLLKIGDFHIDDYVLQGAEQLTESKRDMIHLALEVVAKKVLEPKQYNLNKLSHNGDLRCFSGMERERQLWESNYAGKKVTVKFEKVERNK
jgi:hypothetical protein